MVSECSDFIVDVAKPLAVFVRDRAVIVYEHPIRGTKVVRRLDLVGLLLAVATARCEADR